MDSRLERVKVGGRDAIVIQMRNHVPCTEVEGAEKKVDRLGDSQEVNLSGTAMDWPWGLREGEVTGMPTGFLTQATPRMK